MQNSYVNLKVNHRIKEGNKNKNQNKDKNENGGCCRKNKWTIGLDGKYDKIC